MIKLWKRKKKDKHIVLPLERYHLTPPCENVQYFKFSPPPHHSAGALCPTTIIPFVLPSRPHRTAPHFRKLVKFNVFSMSQCMALVTLPLYISCLVSFRSCLILLLLVCVGDDLECSSVVVVFVVLVVVLVHVVAVVVIEIFGHQLVLLERPLLLRLSHNRQCSWNWGGVE